MAGLFRTSNLPFGTYQFLQHTKRNRGSVEGEELYQSALEAYQERERARLDDARLAEVERKAQRDLLLGATLDEAGGSGGRWQEHGRMGPRYEVQTNPATISHNPSLEQLEQGANWRGREFHHTSVPVPTHKQIVSKGLKRTSSVGGARRKSKKRKSKKRKSKTRRRRK